MPYWPAAWPSLGFSGLAVSVVAVVPDEGVAGFVVEVLGAVGADGVEPSNARAVERREGDGSRQEFIEVRERAPAPGPRVW